MTEKFNPKLSLTADHTGLVLFDVLQAYVHPVDPVKTQTMAELGIAENLLRLLTACRQAGLTVFFAAANHSPDGSDVVERITDTDMDLNPWPEGYQAIRPGVHRGEAQAAVASELTPLDHEIRIPKHRWNAFYQTSLELNLRARRIDTIILAGLSTDVGIASTAFAARDMDLGLVIARDACYAHRGPNHDFFMDRVFPRMGRVLTVAQIETLMLE